MNKSELKDVTDCILFVKQHPEFKKDVLDVWLYNDNELYMFFSTKDDIFIINFMKYIEGIIYGFWQKDDIKNRTKLENLYDRCVDAIAALVDEQPNTNPQQFTKSLTRPQQEYLYGKLTEKSVFLPTNTDFDAFYYVFGGDKKPDDFEPLEWRQSVKLLRELLKGLLQDGIYKTQRFEIPPYFCKHKNKQIISHLSSEKFEKIDGEIITSELSDTIQSILKGI